MVGSTGRQDASAEQKLACFGDGGLLRNERDDVAGLEHGPTTHDALLIASAEGDDQAILWEADLACRAARGGRVTANMNQNEAEALGLAEAEALGALELLAPLGEGVIVGPPMSLRRTIPIGREESRATTGRRLRSRTPRRRRAVPIDSSG